MHFTYLYRMCLNWAGQMYSNYLELISTEILDKGNTTDALSAVRQRALLMAHLIERSVGRHLKGGRIQWML